MIPPGCGISCLNWEFSIRQHIKVEPIFSTDDFCGKTGSFRIVIFLGCQIQKRWRKSRPTTKLTHSRRPWNRLPPGTVRRTSTVRTSPWECPNGTSFCIFRDAIHRRRIFWIRSVAFGLAFAGIGLAFLAVPGGNTCIEAVLDLG